MSTELLPELRECFSIWETGRPTGSMVAGLQGWKFPIYGKPLHMNDHPGTRDVSSLSALCHQGKVWGDAACWDDQKIQCRKPEHPFWSMFREMGTKWKCQRFLLRWFTRYRSEDPLFSRDWGRARYRAGANRAGMPPRHWLFTSPHWIQPVYLEVMRICTTTLSAAGVSTGNQWASKRFTCKYQTSIYRNDTFIFWRKYTWKKMETNNIRHLFLPCNYSGTLNLYFNRDKKCIRLKIKQ